jgi:hypothetical protein
MTRIDLQHIKDLGCFLKVKDDLGKNRHIHIHIHTCTCAYTYTCKYTHTHTHTHTLAYTLCILCTLEVFQGLGDFGDLSGGSDG